MDKAQQRREATEAFRQYAARGENPNRDELLATDAWFSDTAVSQTLSVLSAEGKNNVIDAVREVYFVDPTEPLKRSDIEKRVTHYCSTRFISRSAVYNWLATARTIFWAIAHHQD